MRIVFMGTPEFAVPSLLALHQAGHDLPLVVTQPDRPKGRGRKLACPPVKEAALRLGLPVAQPVKVKEAAFNAQLQEIRPDLIIVVAFGQILPESILALPPFGCINVHASLLPAYRGAAPLHWVILNGEKETGITTMLMDKGLDTGAMLLTEKIGIGPEMTYGALHDLAAQKGSALLLETVDKWPKGLIKPVPQNSGQASYAPPLKKEHEWISWNADALTIYNQIRGLAPWPGAMTCYKGRPLKIRKAQIFPTNRQEASAGSVTAILRGKGFVVQAGQGSLLVQSVQPEGKNTMPSDSFINGYRLEVGYAFTTA